MVREEQSDPDDSIGEKPKSGPAVSAAGDPFPEDKAVARWMQEIRGRIPDNAVLSITVQLKSENNYQASFRLAHEGELLSSEARAPSAEEAVNQAGAGLCLHLPAEGLLRAG